MSELRTWRDALSDQARPRGGQARVVGVAADTGGVEHAGPTVDRHAGDGPPPCCGRRRVAADMLVWYGGIGPDALRRVRNVIPDLEGVDDEDVYLCDGCRGTVRRARVLTAEETPHARPPGSY